MEGKQSLRDVCADGPMVHMAYVVVNLEEGVMYRW